VPYIVRKLFSCTTFLSQVVCLYLEPFRSYLALKLAVLGKIFKNSTYVAFGEDYVDAAPTNSTF